MSDYTLYNGDCFDVLREMPDESVDMVFTDYGSARAAQQTVQNQTRQDLAKLEVLPRKKDAYKEAQK